MRAFEIIDPAKQRVVAMQQQAKAAQKIAKQAALRLKLQTAQKQLSKVNTSPA